MDLRNSNEQFRFIGHNNRDFYFCRKFFQEYFNIPDKKIRVAFPPLYEKVDRLGKDQYFKSPLKIFVESVPIHIYLKIPSFRISKRD